MLRGFFSSLSPKQVILTGLSVLCMIPLPLYLLLHESSSPQSRAANPLPQAFNKQDSDIATVTYVELQEKKNYARFTSNSQKSEKLPSFPVIYPQQVSNEKIAEESMLARSSSRYTTFTKTAPIPSEYLPQTASSESFTIQIPRIDLTQNIIPHVDPSARHIYLPIMEKAVAHGENTALPGQRNGNIYLFAHSRTAPSGITPQGGWFTRIDELESGDTIELYYEGKQFTYVVKRLFIVNPEDIEVYQAHSPFPGENSLTLQTCYPRGDLSQRLIVQATEVQ